MNQFQAIENQEATGKDASQPTNGPNTDVVLGAQSPSTDEERIMTKKYIRYTPEEIIALRERVGSSNASDLFKEADPYITPGLATVLAAAKVDASQIRANLWGIADCREEHKSWERASRTEFENAVGKIYTAPVAEFACDTNNTHTKTHLGDFSIKYRYVIPVVLHETHMDVLLLRTSSGTGGRNLPLAKKKTCIGIKYEDEDYENIFPNP